MLKFLLNGNLSWETKEFLNRLGYQTETIAKFGLSRAQDFEIVQFAQKNKYTIITLDLDFGEIYYYHYPLKVGIIILKLKDQTIESVNRTLKILLDSKIIHKELLKYSLIIFDGTKIRVRRRIEGII